MDLNISPHDIGLYFFIYFFWNYVYIFFDHFFYCCICLFFFFLLILRPLITLKILILYSLYVFQILIFLLIFHNLVTLLMIMFTVAVNSSHLSFMILALIFCFKTILTCQVCSHNNIYLIFLSFLFLMLLTIKSTANPSFSFNQLPSSLGVATLADAIEFGGISLTSYLVKTKQQKKGFYIPWLSFLCSQVKISMFNNCQKVFRIGGGITFS